MSGDYDGLNICAECGEAYTTGTICHNCARQHAIDNDPMEGYRPITDMMNSLYDDGWDYRDFDDGDFYLDMYEDDIGNPYEYDDDETIDLSPSWRWTWFKIKTRVKWLWTWKLSHPVHRLRMKYDKRYRDSYWNDVIPF